MSDIYFADDIQMADFRILCYLWNRETGESDLLVDISNIATSSIRIDKERNKPDSLEVTIEYTQFKEKLNYEGSNPEHILMPFLTEVKIQRNFKTIFAGTLFHLTLNLGEVGKETVTLKCCSWGEHYEKRYVSECLTGSYPEIAQKLVMAGQHEMNWFDNYAFEYTDDYWQGWEWCHYKHWKVTSASTTTLTVRGINYQVGDILYWSGDGGSVQMRVKEIDDDDGSIEQLEVISSSTFNKDQDPGSREYVEPTGGSGTGAIVTFTSTRPSKQDDSNYQNHRIVTSARSKSRSISSAGYQVGDILTWSGAGGTVSLEVKKVKSKDQSISSVSIVDSTVFTEDVGNLSEILFSGGSGESAYFKLNTESDLKPPRSEIQHYNGGVKLLNGESAWTYSVCKGGLTSEELGNLKDLYFAFWYKASADGSVTLTMHADNEGEIGDELLSFTTNVTAAEEWTKHETTIPAATVEDEIRWLKIAMNGADVEIVDLQLYTKPEDHDAYDLDIKLGTFDAQGHKFDKYRMQHYHFQNIKAALYNVSKYLNYLNDAGEPDTFEYEFDENKNFNIYYKQGQSIADPAFAATYPGIIKSLTIERGLEDICNINYATGEEDRSYKDVNGEEVLDTKKWISPYSSPYSMNRFGAMAEFNAYEAIHGYADLDEKAYSDLNIFDEIQNIPEIEVDSNIYNAGNVFLGDTIIVNVLSDPLFDFINGTYRVYKYSLDISVDSVEKMQLTLLPPDMQALQLVSFPVEYKYIKNDVKRLITGANY